MLIVALFQTDVLGLPITSSNGHRRLPSCQHPFHAQDSPISEGGEHGYGPDGDKYAAIRSVLAKYANHTIPDEPRLPPRTALPSVMMSRAAALFANLDILELDGIGGAVELPSSSTVNIEALGQDFGWVRDRFVLLQNTPLPPLLPPLLPLLSPPPPPSLLLPSAHNRLALYRTIAPAVEAGATLSFEDYPRDRATVYVNEAYQGSVYRPEVAPLPLLNGTAGGEVLDILIDVMG